MYREKSEMFAFKYSAGAAARSMPTYDDGSTPTLVTEKPPAIAITQYGEDVAGTFTARHDSSPCADRGQNIAYAVRMREGCRGGGKGPLVQEDVSGTLATGNDQTIFEGGYVVRRLTPTECERLQGFPSVVRLEVEKMTSDELIACALANGDIICDFETGKVYGTRGPGGTKLAVRRELGFKHPTGYIHINLSARGVKKQVRAHRIVYIAAHGGIPDGMVIDHINGVKDDNRLCNLQAMTSEENSHKAKADGAYDRNSDPAQNNRMLPYEIRAEIFYLNTVHGMSYKDLAKMYGCCKSTIGNIVHETGWTDLTGCDADAVADKVAASLLYDERKSAALLRKVRKWSQECPDGPRYKACGNSMAVPNMRWIFERIQAYDTIQETEMDA